MYNYKVRSPYRVIYSLWNFYIYILLSLHFISFCSVLRENFVFSLFLWKRAIFFSIQKDNAVPQNEISSIQIISNFDFLLISSFLFCVCVYVFQKSFDVPIGSVNTALLLMCLLSAFVQVNVWVKLLPLLKAFGSALISFLFCFRGEKAGNLTALR